MFRSLIRVLVPAVMVLVLTRPSEGSKVKVWSHASASHYDKAKFKKAVVTNEGALRLSRQVKPLASLQAAHVWAMVEDRAGNLYAATGDEGKVFKITPDGKASVVYTAKSENQILSLALGADDTLYAGTGPGGMIVTIPARGEARILAEGLGNYVWSLVFDPQTRTLYAGTGPKGCIYQVPPDGKATVFFTTRQDHILSLVQGKDRMLYAGTDKGGLVYRIDSKSKGFVLYDARQGEIHTLLATEKGILAGTSAPVPRGVRSVAGSGSSPTTASLDNQSSAETASSHPKRKRQEPAKVGKAPPSDDDDDEPEKAAKPVGHSPSSDDDPPATKTSAAPAPSPPGSGDNSIYRISPDGTVRELFRDKVMILSLLEHQGRLFAGTGMRGQLFEIDPASKERSELARLESGQIHCLLARRDGSIVMGGGDPGKIYFLEDAYAPTGTVVSDVLDAKIICRWGALTWKGQTPPGTTVTLAVRTGNVSEPDQTWSEWSAELNDPENSKVPSPSARYAQFRVTLSTDNPRLTPELRGLVLRYKNINIAPEITSFDVPDLSSTNLDNPKKLKLKWAAVDANEDELAFNIYVRKEGWKDWVLVEDDIEKKEYEWDTTTFPAGFYQVKVVASDRRDNPPEEALTGQRVSGLIPVANTPPTVRLKVAGMEGDQAIIEAVASDPLVRLTEASFAINGKKWNNVFPRDGLFDSKTENFRFKTGPLQPGTYVLILRVRNASGLVGSGDISLTVREKKNP